MALSFGLRTSIIFSYLNSKDKIREGRWGWKPPQPPSIFGKKRPIRIGLKNDKIFVLQILYIVHMSTNIDFDLLSLNIDQMHRARRFISIFLNVGKKVLKISKNKLIIFAICNQWQIIIIPEFTVIFFT